MKIFMTHGYFLEEDPVEKKIMKPYSPLGLLYVSAYLEKNGYSTNVFDGTFSNFETQKKEIEDFQPDILAIYTNMMTRLNVLKIIKSVKNNPKLKNTKIVLGGPEVTHHVDNFLKFGADFIVIGEGEVTMYELTKYLNNIETNLKDINGLAYLDENKNIVRNKTRDLLKSMDEIPFPDRGKIDYSNYLKAWKENHGNSAMTISTMRGCPYTCKWCSKAVYKQTYRRRSAKLVAEEMKMLKDKYNPDTLWFVDDVFTINYRWLKNFAKEVKNQNAIIPYEIISRADRLNEEVFQNLKDSGCFRVWIGAESGSQKIIDAMDRRVDVIKTREMIQLAKKYNIQAGTFIMLGYPGETKDDIKETINHLVVSNPDSFTITIAYPIKGTELYTEVESKFLESYEWDTTIDRKIDFEREFPKRYYEHAIRWVQTEVYRQTKNEKILKDPWLRFKSLVHQSKMYLGSNKKRESIKK